MSTPVIDSVVPSKFVVAPGEAFTVRIVAHDADSRTVTLDGVVADLLGHSVRGKVLLTVQDVLTYALEDADGAGFTISADAADPTLFHVVAPGA